MANYRSAPIIGLDIGTSKIAVAVAESEGVSGVRILGVGTASSQGLRKGVIINIESTIQAIQEALKQATSIAGKEVKYAYALVSGSHIQGINSHGVVAIKNQEVSKDDIERVIEAAQAVAMPLDREILHVIPQQFIIDEQDGIREPLGISGVRLEARVHLITGASASGQNIIKCAERAGLHISGLSAGGLSAAKAVVTPEEMELGTCVVDIGGGTTDIVVYHNGAVKYSGVLPLGGSHITNDIAAGLRTPTTSAEEIKCEYGRARAASVSPHETIEVASTGGRPPRILSQHVLSEIIEPRVVEIFSLLQRELIENSLEELLTSGVVITGGCAKLHGIEEVAESVLNLPVRIGRPRNVSGLTDVVQGPEFAGAVGLLLQHSTAKELRGGNSFSIKQSYRKVANWFGSHF